MTMNAAIEKLLEAIVADYVAWHNVESVHEHKREGKLRMIENFKNKLSVKSGKKYIKVISDDSVWGFIVNTADDPQFRYGDILKAAGWATPARNSARGNVFGEYSVAWTGPQASKARLWTCCFLM
jgi:hypothetical protein